MPLICAPFAGVSVAAAMRGAMRAIARRYAARDVAVHHLRRLDTMPRHAALPLAEPLRLRRCQMPIMLKRRL